VPARALPRQLDVGGDGPQPWLGVAGRSERPHLMHPRCRACDRRQTPSPDLLLCVFIPEVIQVLLDCRASVARHGHQGTSRRLRGSRSRLRRCASRPEPSTLRRRASAVETSRGFADLRLGNCYFIDDRCLIGGCFIESQQLRLAVPDQGVVEDLARGDVPPFVDQARWLGRSGDSAKVFERLDEYPLVVVLRVQGLPAEEESSPTPVKGRNEIRQEVMDRFGTRHDPRRVVDDPKILDQRSKGRASSSSVEVGFLDRLRLESRQEDLLAPQALGEVFSRD
jgi:hypothetical protein